MLCTYMEYIVLHTLAPPNALGQLYSIGPFTWYSALCTMYRTCSCTSKYCTMYLLCTAVHFVPLILVPQGFLILYILIRIQYHVMYCTYCFDTCTVYVRVHKVYILPNSPQSPQHSCKRRAHITKYFAIYYKRPRHPHTHHGNPKQSRRAHKYIYENILNFSCFY
jgi:hypothetical protein